MASTRTSPVRPPLSEASMLYSLLLFAQSQAEPILMQHELRVGLVHGGPMALYRARSPPSYPCPPSPALQGRTSTPSLALTATERTGLSPTHPRTSTLRVRTDKGRGWGACVSLPLCRCCDGCATMPVIAAGAQQVLLAYLLMPTARPCRPPSAAAEFNVYPEEWVSPGCAGVGGAGRMDHAGSAAPAWTQALKQPRPGPSD